MTDRGGEASLLPYVPTGVTGSDDDDDQMVETEQLLQSQQFSQRPSRIYV